MEPRLLIIIYSKYSSQCHRIIANANSLPDNIRLLSIDNANIRKRLVARFNIKTVPCILMFYDSNQIEKYEGVEVTEWIDNTLLSTPQTTQIPENTPQKTILQLEDEKPSPPKSIKEIAAEMAAERDKGDSILGGNKEK